MRNHQSSLKIEQQDNLTFWIRKIKETPKDSFEFLKSSVNYKLLIVIEQIELWKEMLAEQVRKRICSIIYNFLESLILAQDERWRRA